jgi:hypothetical protein
LAGRGGLCIFNTTGIRVFSVIDALVANGPSAVE